jgi:hypothetical protein
MLAVGMVSGAVCGPTREQRERRALAAWRLLGVEVGPVRPFPVDEVDEVDGADLPAGEG